MDWRRCCRRSQATRRLPLQLMMTMVVVMVVMVTVGMTMSLRRLQVVASQDRLVRRSRVPQVVSRTPGCVAQALGVVPLEESTHLVP